MSMLGAMSPAARVYDSSAAYYPAGQAPSPAAPAAAADQMTRYSANTWSPYEVGSQDFHKEAYIKMATSATLLGGGAILGAIGGIAYGLLKK